MLRAEEEKMLYFGKAGAQETEFLGFIRSAWPQQGNINYKLEEEEVWEAGFEGCCQLFC